MRKVAVFIVFAFLVGCCFVSGVSNAIDHIPVDNNKSEKPSETPVGNPMTFQWPMRGHDAQNTCRSEYDASQNQGYEKWKYFVDDPLDSATPVIDSEGTLYIKSVSDGLYAIYPNGTLKWHCDLVGLIEYQPAIGLNGTIYVGTLKYFYAFYPNGTLKWRFGTIYDTHDAPLIGDDGTIYIVAVNHIVAVNPDGIEKWRTPSIGTGFSPALLPDGTIVYSSLAEDVFGLDPDDGHTRWHYQLDYNPEDKTRPVISSDGTVFFAYTDQSGEKAYMSALNPDGTLRWTASITSDIYPYDGMFLGSTPSIGADGTVYVTTWFIRGNSTYHDFGYIHAFNQLNPNAPITPTITGPPKGKVGVQHEYTFTSTSPTGKDVYYYIMWGDDTYTNWIGPFQSGEPVSVNHSWSKWGRYTIQARARDSDNLWGPWGTLEVTMPKNKGVFNDHSILSWLFERFPHAFPILRYLSDQ